MDPYDSLALVNTTSSSSRHVLGASKFTSRIIAKCAMLFILHRHPYISW